MTRRHWGKKKDLKAPYAVLDHLVDAAAAALVLWDVHYTPGMRRWICDELRLAETEARGFTALLAGLHDLAKIIPCFQDREPAPGQPGWIGHDVAAQLVAPRLLNPSGEIWALSPEYRIAQVLGGHHGRYHAGWEREMSDPARLGGRLGGEEFWADRSAVFELIREVLGQPKIPVSVPVPVAGVLTGLVTLADWLVSDTDWFIPAQQEDAPTELPARLSFTICRLRGVVADSGLEVPEFTRSVSMQETWEATPYPLQRSVSEEFAPRVTEAGLLIITDSTGNGKTEAAYLAAHALGQVTDRPGIFVGLPTRATTDQARQRLRDFAGRAAVGSPPVTLAHAMASFNDTYRQDGDVASFLRPLNRTLLAGLCAGTIDQALLAALAAPFNMLRMHGLTGKTLIIDEVHAYDPYMQGLLGVLLSWCGRLGVPVVLLSATLPGHVSTSLATAYLRGAGESEVDFEVAYPGWTFVGGSGKTLRPSRGALADMARFGRREVEIDRRAHDRSANSRIPIIKEYVAPVARDGGCILVVCNTVDSAQETFQALTKELPDGVPLLLHARFPQHQREELTSKVIDEFGTGDDRPYRRVLVATQVVEQSLNLDFDLVISDIAPLSLLIQRLGRCWRFLLHDNDEPIRRPAWSHGPKLVVLDPVDLGSAVPTPPEWDRIYPAFEVAATHQVLRERPATVSVPDQVDELVQQVHDAQAEGVPAHLRQLWDEQYGAGRAQTQLARMAAIDPPDLVTDVSRLTDPEVSDLDASTRMGVDTARLIPRYTSPDGRQWLDADHTIPWPTSRPKPQTVETIISCSVTCPRAWAEDAGLETNPTWSRTPLLRDAYILPAPTCGALSLDAQMGLVRGRKESS